MQKTPTRQSDFQDLRQELLTIDTGDADAASEHYRSVAVRAAKRVRRYRDESGGRLFGGIEDEPHAFFPDWSADDDAWMAVWAIMLRGFATAAPDRLPSADNIGGAVGRMERQESKPGGCVRVGAFSHPRSRLPRRIREAAAVLKELDEYVLEADEEQSKPDDNGSTLDFHGKPVSYKNNSKPVWILRKLAGQDSVELADLVPGVWDGEPYDPKKRDKYRKPVEAASKMLLEANTGYSLSMTGDVVKVLKPSLPE